MLPQIRRPAQGNNVNKSAEGQCGRCGTATIAATPAPVAYADFKPTPMTSTGQLVNSALTSASSCDISATNLQSADSAFCGRDSVAVEGHEGHFSVGAVLSIQSDVLIPAAMTESPRYSVRPIDG